MPISLRTLADAKQHLTSQGFGFTEQGVNMNQSVIPLLDPPSGEIHPAADSSRLDWVLSVDSLMMGFRSLTRSLHFAAREAFGAGGSAWFREEGRLRLNFKCEIGVFLSRAFRDGSASPHS